MTSGEESIKGLIVEPSGSGKGLPYAPENWPEEGDKWGWQVRKRISKSGFFTDRFLFPPDRLKRVCLSKPKVEKYIKKRFPGTDVQDFFASFTWKIPATATALHLIEEEISNIQNQSDSGSDTLRTYILKRSYEIKKEVRKLDNEIHVILQSLKMSQESEYMTAKKKFYSHKYICIGLFGQLNVERAKLVKHVSTLNNRRDLKTNRANLLKKLDQMNQKFVNLEKKVGQMNQDVVNLENKIDVVLQSLRRLQEYEYRLVQKNLYARKRRLLDLQGELPVKSHTTMPIDDGNLYYLCIVNQMKQEVVKLRDTTNISKR